MFNTSSLYFTSAYSSDLNTCSDYDLVPTDICVKTTGLACNAELRKESFQYNSPRVVVVYLMNGKSTTPGSHSNKG